MNELNAEQQEELKTILLSLRGELQQALEQSDKSSQPVSLDQQAFGRVSRVDALQQQSMAKASQQQYQERLRQVLKALANFDSGDYGYCLSCNNPIGYPRLQARPETPLCLACQSAAEQQ
ncbi:MAG: TraR/DksA family transcriptional regulator [Endozoicomonas sp.]